MDELRQACGGAGFTSASLIAELWANFSPSSTFEGTNVVMLQQSSRYILKMAKKALKGTKSTGYFEYINRTQEILQMKSQASSIAEFVTLDHLDQAMSVNAAKQL